MNHDKSGLPWTQVKCPNNPEHHVGAVLYRNENHSKISIPNRFYCTTCNLFIGTISIGIPVITETIG